MRQLLNRVNRRRILAPALLAGIAALASLGTAGPVQAQSLNEFASFSVSSGKFQFTDNHANSLSSFTGTETVTFNYTVPNIFKGATTTTYTGATATLSTVQTAAGTSLGGGLYNVPVTGSLKITEPGQNLLTVNFTGGVLKISTNAGNLSADISSGDMITYSSSVLNQAQLSGITGAAFSIGLNGIKPSLTVDSTHKTFNTFTTTAAGSFSAAVVPEPATLAMFGFGLAGIPAMLLVKRRKAIASA